MNRLYNTMPRLLKPSQRIKLLVCIAMACCLESIACGPGLYEDDARFCLFRPSIIQYPQLDAMQYSQRLYHPFDPDDLHSENDDNCKEWLQFTNGKVKYDHIYELQYNTPPDSFLIAYQTNNWERFKGNSFIKWLLARKNKHALEYFAVAKSIEKTQTTYRSDWGAYIYEVQSESLDSLKQICYDRSQKKLPAFLKHRYAFQYLKSAYYSTNSEHEQTTIQEVFQYLIANSNSITTQWSYIYYALLQTNNQQQAHYLVQAFDKCDAKKYRAFSLLSASTLDTLGKTTDDAYIRVMARAIAAMKHPGRSLEDIRFVYEADPDNKYLPLLITREINKLEDWLYSPEVLYFSPFLQNNWLHTTTDEWYARHNIEFDKKYLRELLILLQHMQQTGFARKNFLLLSIAHLHNMLHEHLHAESILSSMETPSEDEEKASFLLEQLFTFINTQPLMEEGTQQQAALLINEMEAINSGRKNKHTDTYQHELGNMLLYLSRKYQAAGATVVAGLLYDKASVMTNEYIYPARNEDGFYGFIAYFEKYAHTDDIDALLALKHKQNKTSFEQFITPPIWGSDNIYLDLKGTLHFRKGDFKQALKVFENLPEDFWQHTYAFADYLPLTSVSEVEKEIPVSVGNKKTYSIASKKQIVEDILGIQQQLNASATNREKALYTFWLANARFNISYFGKAWMAYAYGKTSREPNTDSRDMHRFAYYYINPNKTNDVSNYYYLKEARKLYEQALQLAGNDRELQAQCLMMLGICDEYQHVFDPPANTGFVNGPSYRSLHFTALNKLYSKTKFFEAVAVSCPDIKRIAANDAR